MRKIFFMLLVFAGLNATGQAVSAKYLFNYIRVWGFLKYYHPAVGNGMADADMLFMAWIEKIRAVKTDNEYRKIMDDLGASLGKMTTAQSGTADTARLFMRNDRTAWISQDKLLSPALRSQLQALRKKGYTDTVHRYMPAGPFDSGIPAELVHANVNFPNIDVQLLALARYWNAIEYLFPYKYMITQDWSSVLKQQLPFFAKQMAAADFELHLLQLNSAIEDTHGGIVAIRQTAKIYGPFFPPFVFAVAGDTIIVTGYLDSLACAQQDIRKGDFIIRVRNIGITRAFAEDDRLVSASNLPKKKSLLSSIPLLKPFRGKDSVVSIDVLRNGRLIKKQLVMQKALKKDFVDNLNAFYRRQSGNGSSTQNDFVLRSVTPDIAQVDAARLSILYNSSADDHAIDSVLQQMVSHKKAILFDMRCYATQAVFYNKVLSVLGRPLKPFARLLVPYKRYPGTYIEHDVFSPVAQPPFQSRYTGKIIILVDGETQSQSELITMIMQASGPVTVIGSQTAGCDGDLIDLPVPGDYELTFSGRHVQYPDGTPSQKLGVKRDVKVDRTAKAIAAGRDEILEKAVEVAVK